MSAPLDLIRALEEREAELAVRSEGLHHAQVAAETIADRAGRIAELLDRLPSERTRADRELAGARSACARDRDALERARASGADDEVSRRRVTEAESVLRRSQGRLEQAERSRAELETQAAATVDEVSRLEEQAREAASLLGSFPSLASRDVASSASGLDGLLGWAPRARAAAFVARGQVDRERETLIRQAEEAAASLLGESFAGSSVAVVRRRLEAS
jgi:chromosome segregation ATPase